MLKTFSILAVSAALSLAACSQEMSPTGLGAQQPSPASDTLEQQTADLNTTASVRMALTQETQLQTDAQNVSISTQNQVVTLQGTVSSETCKKAVEKMAQSVPGVVTVDNQLAVAAH